LVAFFDRRFASLCAVDDTLRTAISDEINARRGGAAIAEQSQTLEREVDKVRTLVKDSMAGGLAILVDRRVCLLFGIVLSAIVSGRSRVGGMGGRGQT
jgi:hypothetical protein